MILIPKIVTTLQDYDRKQLISDLSAGAVVGVVAIPLALAFAIASGLPPERGLYTAAIAGFLISLFGGSRVQIGGPTGAFVVIVYQTIHQYGLDGLAICTLVAGFILVALGLARMGAMIKFIPYPMTLGFTAGIAAIIFSSQVKDLLGLSMAAVPPDFIDKWRAYWAAAPSISMEAALLSAGSLAILFIWPRFSRQIPSPIVALIAATAGARVLGLHVETIGTRFGALPSALPSFSWPAVDAHRLGELVRPSFTIAMLAAIESLLSAVVADGMIGGRHRSNMELIAQGVANIASISFGGMPATGAIARTATNVKCGGRTPVAGMIHAVVVFCAVLFLKRWIMIIPLCVLASILVIVSLHMSEWRSFLALLRAPRSDVAVLLTTFFLTIFADLTLAVEIGLVLAALLFIRRMAEVTSVEALRRDLEDKGEDPPASGKLALPPGVEVYKINGPFFFGAAGKLRDTLSDIQRPPKIMILEMRHVPVMDATGLRALEEFQDRCRRKETKLILSGICSQPLQALKNSGKLSAFDHVLAERGLHEALELAQTINS